MWRNIIYLCFLTALLLTGFQLLFMPDLLLFSYTPVYRNIWSALATDGSSTSIVQIVLGVAGLIYLKIIWRLVNPPDHH